MSIKTFDCLALAAQNTSGKIKKLIIQRRCPLADDVVIEIHYSGICHSDLHQLRGEWNQDVYYPMVPGHEIVGFVTEVGSAVKKFKVGDRVGVGCMVDSCRKCYQCTAGNEHYCLPGSVSTYNDCIKEADRVRIKNSEEGELLFGGYSTHITVTEAFVVRVPESIPLEVAAPLLCAGITTYSPLMHFGAIAQQIHHTSRLQVAIAGFGGLGHMAVKIAKKLGHHVTVLSTSSRKRQAALETGADAFVISTDEEQMKQAAKSFHLVIDTISADHPIPELLKKLLRAEGIWCLVGLPAGDIVLGAFDVVGNRRVFTGSPIGSIKETQEMLDFCGANRIFPDVELINAKDVNHKLHQLGSNSSDSRRYVIRVKDTLAPFKDNNSWQVEGEPEIDISNWKVHPSAVIHPASANVHVGVNYNPVKKVSQESRQQQQKQGINKLQLLAHLAITGVALYAFSQIRKSK